MADIMSLFRTSPTPAPAAGTPALNPNPNNDGKGLPGTQASAGTAPNGTVPAGAPNGNPGDPGNSNANPASPLDKFADVWKNDPTQTSAPTSVFGNVDPKAIMESAKKVNFANVVSQEQLQALAAGGEGAVKAFAEAMNLVAQSVYAQSALATTKMVDQALSKAQESYDARIPSMVKKLSTSEGLINQNPHLANPALQPMVEALNEQFTRKYPSATSTEIQSMVNDYFSAVGGLFAPKPKESNTGNGNRGAQEVDWEAFMR